MKLDASWPMDRPPDEVLAQVIQRARARRQRRITGVLVAALLLGGPIALLTHEGSPTGIQTIDQPDVKDDTNPGGERQGDQVVAGGTTEPGGETTVASTTTSTSTTEAGGRTAAVGVHPDRIVFGNVSSQTFGPSGNGKPDGQTFGAKAAVAYQNSVGGVWGRKLELDVRDDQFNPARNVEQTQQLTRTAFALLASWSTFDHASVDALRGNDMPDVTAPHNEVRQEVANNINVEPHLSSAASTTAFEWFRAQQPAATNAVASLYMDANEFASRKRAAVASGWRFTYERSVLHTETEFTADILRMRQSGVRTVYIVGFDAANARRLADQMQEQKFVPDLVVGEDVPLTGPTNPDVEGMYGTRDTLLLDGQDDAGNAEVKLFRGWLARVAPGRVPDRAAALGWASGRLLFAAMTKAGPLASRAQVLDTLHSVGTYDDNGLLAPARPGEKTPSTCVIIAQLRQGRAARVEPATGFRCGGRAIG